MRCDEKSIEKEVLEHKDTGLRAQEQRPLLLLVQVRVVMLAVLGQVLQHLLLLLLQYLRFFVENVRKQVLDLQSRSRAAAAAARRRTHTGLLKSLRLAQCFQNSSPEAKRHHTTMQHTATNECRHDMPRQRRAG